MVREAAFTVRFRGSVGIADVPLSKAWPLATEGMLYVGKVKASTECYCFVKT